MDTIIAESNDEEKMRAIKMKEQMAYMEKKPKDDMALSGQNAQAAYDNIAARMQKNTAESKALLQQMFELSRQQLAPLQQSMGRLSQQQERIGEEKKKRRC